MSDIHQLRGPVRAIDQSRLARLVLAAVQSDTAAFSLTVQEILQEGEVAVINALREFSQSVADTAVGLHGREAAIQYLKLTSLDQEMEADLGGE